MTNGADDAGDDWLVAGPVEPDGCDGPPLQATAVATGAVALLLQAHSWWTPDQVKYALTSTAHPLANVSRSVQGAGQLHHHRDERQPE